MSSRIFAAAILLLSCLSASGAAIADFALGSQLSGAIVTVTRFGGPMSSATFVPSGTGAVASTSGSGGVHTDSEPRRHHGRHLDPHEYGPINHLLEQHPGGLDRPHAFQRLVVRLRFDAIHARQRPRHSRCRPPVGGRHREFDESASLGRRIESGRHAPRSKFHVGGWAHCGTVNLICRRHGRDRRTRASHCRTGWNRPLVVCGVDLPRFVVWRGSAS